MWVAAALAAGGWAASEADRAAARAALVEGVSAIDAPGGGIPGGYILIGDDVIPLAECRNYDGTTAFTAVAAFYGRGRAVLLAHPNFLSQADFLKDTKRLLQNAVSWTAKGKSAPRIAVLRDPAVARTFTALGCTNVTRLAGIVGLDAYDVLALNGIRREEIPAVLAFVEKGGGLVHGSLGWGYMYSNPNACFAESFADNRLTGALGAIMGSTGVNRMPAGGFTTDFAALCAGTTIDDALARAERGAFGDKTVRRQVVKTLFELANGLPSGVRPDLHARLSALAARPEANAQPSPERPLDAELPLARLAVLLRKNAWLACPEKVWPADPAASVYPGLTRPGTPSVTRTVPVDLAVPRWHSTGVYAPAGQALTIRIEAAAAKLGLKVRVGSTADDLSGLAEWKRFPLVTVTLPLVKTETTFASPFGGLVYIVVPDGREGSATVELDGGIMAPWFRLGRDTNAEFARQCAETGAPWGEIEGEDFIVTAETAGLRRVADPQWIASFWDRVLKADQELAGWETRRSPERICADVQLTTGWLHSGYPLMSHINAAHFDWAIDQARLKAGDCWGVYHEIGHNHQSRDWTPEGTGEVTVNIFTMYALETVVGADLRDARYPCGAEKARRRVAEWVKRGRRFQDWKNDYFLALEMYLRIKEAYGWDAYKKTFARYRLPGAKHPRADADIWNTFARELSATVEADMAAVLSEWSIPLSDETRSLCAKFPAAKPSLTEGLQTVAPAR